MQVAPGSAYAQSVRHTRATHTRRLTIDASLSSIHELAKLKALEEFATIPDEEGKPMLLPLCASTGYYGCGANTIFSTFGGGTSSFFKTIKALTIVFFIVSLLSLPSLVINAYGDGNDYSLSSIRLSSTTIGHVASVANASTIAVPFSTRKLSKTEAGLIYAYCDIAGAVVLLLAFCCMKYWQLVEDVEVSANNITLDQYSLYVRGFPPDVREREVKAHFEGVLPGGKVAQVSLVKDNMHLYGKFVSRGKIFRKLERLEEQVNDMEAFIESGEAPADTCCGGPRAQLRRLQRQRQLLVDRATSINEEADDLTSDTVVAVFVTFEHQDIKALIESDYSTSSMRWLFQPRRLRFHRPDSSYRLTVAGAPPPSAVSWENLNKGFFERGLRQLITAVIATVVIVGSFVLLFFTSVQQARLAASDLAVLCTTPEIATGIASRTINATSVANLAVNDPALFCYCETLGFGAMDLRMISSQPLVSKCPAQTCPRIFKLAADSLLSLSFCVDWVRQQSITTALIVVASVGIVVVNVALGQVMLLLTQFEAHHSRDALERSLSLRLFIAQFINTAVLIVIINAPIDRYVNVPFYTSKFEDFTPDWYANVGVNIMTTMLIQIITPHIYGIFMHLYTSYRRRNTKATALRDLQDVYRPPEMLWSLRYAQIFAMMFVCYIFSTGMPLLNVVAFGSLLVAYLADKFLFSRLWARPPLYGSTITRSMHNLLPIIIAGHLAVGVWAISNSKVFSETYDPLSVRGAAIVAAAAGNLQHMSLVNYAVDRVVKGQALPMLITFLFIVLILFSQALVRTLGVFSRALLNFITCGQCARQVSADGGVALALQVPMPSLSECRDPVYCQQHPEHYLIGEPTYSMLLNKQVQAAFAIVPEFAQMATDLDHVARYAIAVRQVDGRSQLVATWTATQRNVLEKIRPKGLSKRQVTTTPAKPANQHPPPTVLGSPPQLQPHTPPQAPQYPISPVMPMTPYIGGGSAVQVQPQLNPAWAHPVQAPPPYDGRVLAAALHAAQVMQQVDGQNRVQRMQSAVDLLRRDAQLMLAVSNRRLDASGALPAVTVSPAPSDAAPINRPSRANSRVNVVTAAPALPQETASDAATLASVTAAAGTAPQVETQGQDATTAGTAV